LTAEAVSCSAANSTARRADSDAIRASITSEDGTDEDDDEEDEDEDDEEEDDDGCERCEGSLSPLAATTRGSELGKEEVNIG